MHEALDYIESAIQALETAEQDLFTAADHISDVAADRWADVGGIGRPPKDGNAERLYALSKKVEALYNLAADVRERIDA